MAMRTHWFTAAAMTLLLAGGCDTTGEDAGATADGGAAGADGGTAPEAVAVKPGAETETTAKIGGPVSIAYRIVGQPVIGQPLSIDLRVSSALGDQPVRLDYRILDASALQLAEAQTPFATVAPSAGEQGQQQVTVVPLREGRLFLNVAATVETAEGSMSTVTAIPIQVGDRRREPVENGRLETGENGDSVRVLSGSED